MRAWQFLCLSAGFLTASAAIAVEIGEEAPDFSLPAMAAATGETPRGESTDISLAAYRGKVVFLDFWSAWCAPCRATMPALAELRGKYSRDRFEVIGINVDPELDAARRLLADLEPGYPIASDLAAEFAKIYGVVTLPASFIVDADGRIRHAQHGPAENNIAAIESRISALLEPSLRPIGTP